MTSFDMKSFDASKKESALDLKRNYVYFFSDGTCSDLSFSLGPKTRGKNKETRNSLFFSLNPLTGALSSLRGQEDGKT
jgi:hypothetical protein